VTTGLTLDTDRTAFRERPARARAAPVLAREVLVAKPAVEAWVAPLAKLARSAYLGSSALLILAFVAVLLLDGGWQAAAAGLAVGAGMAALVAFTVAVTLADQV
jgi:hypothetical protein